MDSNGVRVDNPHQISTLFLEYYNQILGSKMVNRKSVLEGVMRQGEKKHWPSVVWSRLNCPKHSFIFWLTILQRLKTKDRVKRLHLTKQYLDSKTATHMYTIKLCNLRLNEGENNGWDYAPNSSSIAQHYKLLAWRKTTTSMVVAHSDNFQARRITLPDVRVASCQTPVAEAR
ncbi:hypothetical protein G4B88_019195 [Cannabis sativa]|uniref:Reverse transcriptase zinc-binding domain-containing protein n=1 Tax=Cannabis sativa TaxID=3483 RepID=A0A7J6HN12_CANSA|nr:hypothetical protein G4B88_019195 [Cannabis sativa]